MMYKTKKVFESKDMPASVKDTLVWIYSHLVDTRFVQHEVMAYSFYDENDDLVYSADWSAVDDWLTSNGAKEGEYVLIEHVW